MLPDLGGRKIVFRKNPKRKAWDKLRLVKHEWAGNWDELQL
jgi:hypothetical protein